jgi:DNA-binding CsgD family transcriptional regulator
MTLAQFEKLGGPCGTCGGSVVEHDGKTCAEVEEARVRQLGAALASLPEEAYKWTYGRLGPPLKPGEHPGVEINYGEGQRHVTLPLLGPGETVTIENRSAQTVVVHPHPDSEVRRPHYDLSRLSGAERAVVQLLARGHTRREAAALLFRSLKTVETHVSAIRRKFNIKTGVEWMALLREFPI